MVVKHIRLGTTTRQEDTHRVSGHPFEGQGQWFIQGRTRICQWGTPNRKTSSSEWKVTATNCMHSSDLKACGKKFCNTIIFGSMSKSNFDKFWCRFWLSHFHLLSFKIFNFNRVKCLTYIYFYNFWLKFSCKENHYKSAINDTPLPDTRPLVVKLVDLFQFLINTFVLSVGLVRIFNVSFLWFRGRLSQ